MMESLFQYLSVTYFLLIVLLFIIFERLCEMYQFVGMPPGPRLTSLPLVGNLYDLADVDSFRESTKSLRNIYGGAFSMKLGSYKVVVVSTYEAIKEVLVTRSKDYAGRPPFHSSQIDTLGGKGVTFADDGPSWTLHRKLVVSSLRHYITNESLLESKLTQQAKKIIQHFEKQKGKAFDPGKIITDAVASFIADITFGNQYSLSKSDLSELLELNDMAMNDVSSNNEVFVLDFFPLAKYFKPKVYEESKEIMDGIFEIIQYEIKERKKRFNLAKPSGKDVVGMLLKARHDAQKEGNEELSALLSDDHMAATIEDMFTAGSETTATALKWALAFLVNFPRYQEQIHQQLNKIVGHDRMPCLSDRAQLPLLQATILETLRCGNVADQTGPHYTVRDTRLGEYCIPKHTVVLVDLESLHLDSQQWEEPAIFNPGRHLDSNGELVTSRGLYPFGAGRRVCAGESIAKSELFLLLSWILHKFTLRLEDHQRSGEHGVEGFYAFTHYPKPYKIHAIKRHHMR